MNAREAAREASSRIEGVTYFPDDSWGEFPEGVEISQAEQVADAASDVWEPLLKDALALMKRGIFPGLGAVRDGLVARLEEALGT